MGWALFKRLEINYSEAIRKLHFGEWGLAASATMK